MARGPITLSLPSFSGATSKLVLISVAVFFTSAILSYSAPEFVGTALGGLLLIPARLLHGQVWRLLTYEFLPVGILGMLFSMISLWFIGNAMEDRYGSRWLVEFYLLTAAGGGLLASLIAATGVFKMSAMMGTGGAWAPIMALLLAFAAVSGEEMMRFNFIFNMKVKYLVGLYVLYYLAVFLVGDDRFGALTCLCGALIGYAYMRFAPRRGFLPNVSFNLSERYYTMRNEYYRRKRRNAAKKFEVYMRKQDREVHFDKDGRYVAPDDEKRDPTDKRWMN
jgi:membrane associated rhomboid family serine protease